MISRSLLVAPLLALMLSCSGPSVAPAPPTRPVPTPTEHTVTVPAPAYQQAPIVTATSVRPPAPAIPAGATARCKDGTYSFSKTRQGTCSKHGGVAQWY